jgi:putative lipoprotein
MEQESAYLGLLETAATYSTANGSLTIFDANGNAVLNYKPAVAGELNYKARIALPDTAQVIVTLEDVSKADAPAVMIGQTIMAAPAGPPIPFVVTYSLNDIDSTHTYAVRAQIKDADGALLFTSTTSYQVITRGNPSYVEIELVQP